MVAFRANDAGPACAIIRWAGPYANVADAMKTSIVVCMAPNKSGKERGRLCSVD